MNGGTLEIDSPYPYSAVADGLLKALGVDPPALEKAATIFRSMPASSHQCFSTARHSAPTGWW